MQNLKIKFILFTLTITAMFSSCNKTNELSLPSVFSDNMVLQQNSDVAVWGKAKPGSSVTIEADWGIKESVETQQDGSWFVNLFTVKAGGPHKISISNADSVITFNNVMLGEVWLASGQSNMEMPLSGWLPNDPIDNSEELISTANNSDIRMFTVEKTALTEPRNDVSGKWETTTPQSAENFSATAYFFAKKLYEELKVPIGIIHSSWGGSAAEAWISCEMLAIDRDFGDVIKQINSKEYDNEIGNQTPSALYNGMISGITPYSVAGTIWYQGETNVGRSKQYMRLKSMLITDWRNRFMNETMPFYYVQLAPWHYNDPEGRSSAHLREAQRRMLAIPNTGMAVTLDIGNLENIHPSNKKDVGKRLASWALFEQYGIDTPFTGPQLSNVTTSNEKITLHFDHTYGELNIKKDITPQFEIAGENGEFVTANTTIEDNRIILSSNSVSAPVNARYAYRNNSEASLFNKAGFPAPSFTTENDINE
ncbi:sialate O-acetylesterase [Marinilabiliaceae bacterium ANBcel2]|nr:sialate O-acetylesterase [Marinilabiliaceae bacterium ANBcel2]